MCRSVDTDCWNMTHTAHAVVKKPVVTCIWTITQQVSGVICLKVHVSQFVPFLLLQYNQVPNATSISTTKTTAEEINTVSKGERSRGTCFGGVLVISSLQK